MAKCPVCGAPMERDTCGYCGYVDKAETPQASNTSSMQRQVIHAQILQSQGIMAGQAMGSAGIIPGVSRKKKLTALLLCIFLGGFGIHRFYVGKVGMGILYLFTFGLFGIGWVVDLILIAAGAFRDEFDLPLKE